MLKKLVYLGIAGLIANKISYNLFLKSTALKKYSIEGKGNALFLTYNPLGKR